MDTSNDTLKRYYKKKKKRKQRRKFAFYSMLIVFFVLLVTVLSLTVFFNINDIAVTGNEYYTREQLIEVSGLHEGQNLFRLNKFKIIEKMKKELPYLSEVNIDRHLPVGIEISVTECKPYLCAQSGADYYILDENLKILEKTDVAPESLFSVSGIDAGSFNPGDTLTDENGVAARLATLTKSLKKYIGDNCVTAIDVSSSYDISFTYLDRLKIEVGTVENIDLKLQSAKYVIDDNKSNEHAIVDVSSGKRVYYRPIDESELDSEKPSDEQTTEQTETEPEENDGKQPESESEKENN